MTKDLVLKVMFRGAGNLGSHMKGLSGSTRAVAKELAAARREHKALQGAQRDLNKFREVRRGMKDLSEETKRNEQKIRQLRVQLQGEDADTRKHTRSLAAATKRRELLIAKQRKQADTARNLRGELQNAGISTRNLARDEAQLKAKLEASSAAMDRQKKRLLQLNGAQDRYQKRMQTAANLRGTGASALALGAAALAPIAASARAAGEFEQSLTDIGIKGDLSRRKMEAMGATMRKIARDTNQLNADIVRGVDVLVEKGLDPQRALKMVGPIGRAATAYRADVADIGAAAFSTIDSLGVPIGKTAQALDIMARAGKAGSFEMKDMATHFPALTAAAKGLGMQGTKSVAELGAALQIVRKGAGSSDQAANNLLNLMNKINSPATLKKFEKMGIDLPAMMKAAEARGQSQIEAIAEITAKATGGDLKKLGFLFEDMQVQAALRPLLQNMDLYRKIRSEALGASGDVENDFARRMGDNAEKAKRFTAVISDLGLRVGNAVLPTLTMLAENAGLVLDTFGRWADRNPALFKTLALIFAAIAAGILIFGGLALAASAVLGPFALMSLTFTKALPLLGLMKTGAMLLGRAVLFLGRAFMLNPIGLLVTALAIAAYLIWTHWDTIKAAFFAAVAWLRQAWNWIRAQFNAGVQWLNSLVPGMGTIGVAIIKGLVAGIMSAPMLVFNALKSIVMRGVTGIKEMLGIKSPSRVFAGFGMNISQGLADGISARGRAAVTEVTGLSRRLTDAIALGTAATTLAVTPAGASPAAQRSGAGLGAALAGATINLNVYAAPGQSAEDIAGIVRDMLEAEARKAEAARRSTFADDEDA